MQHYKYGQAKQMRGDSRRGRASGGQPASSSSSSALARRSATDQSLASPALLPAGAATGAGADGREKSATGKLDALTTPQPAMRAVGERQFLYIQVMFGQVLTGSTRRVNESVAVLQGVRLKCAGSQRQHIWGSSPRTGRPFSSRMGLELKLEHAVGLI